MNFTKIEDENLVTYKLEGELSHINSYTLRDIQYEIELASKDLILDLEKITAVDSRGLAFLMNVSKTQFKNKRTMRIINVLYTVKEIFDMCAVSNLLHVELKV